MPPYPIKLLSDVDKNILEDGICILEIITIIPSSCT